MIKCYKSILDMENGNLLSGKWICIVLKKSIEEWKAIFLWIQYFEEEMKIIIGKLKEKLILNKIK